MRLDMEARPLESSPTGLLSVAEIEHLRRASIADFDSVDGDDEEEEITTVIARLPSDALPDEDAFVAALPKPVAPPSVRIALGPVAPPRGARAGVFSATEPLCPPPPPSSNARAITPPPPPSSVRMIAPAPPSSARMIAPPPRPAVLTPLPPDAPRTFPPGDSVFPPSTLATPATSHVAPRLEWDIRASATMAPAVYQWSIPQPTFVEPVIAPRERMPRWAKVYFAFVAVILAASAVGWIVTR